MTEFPRFSIATLLALALTVNLAPLAAAQPGHLPEDEPGAPPFTEPPAHGAWRKLAEFGVLPTPAGRLSHSLIHDSKRDRLVAFGGLRHTTYHGDTWEFSLKGTRKWSVFPASNLGPSPRHAHTAIYDPIRDRMIVFGGASPPSDQTRHNDVWTLDFTGDLRWTKLLPSGSPPSGRFVHAAIYDPVRDRMLVFGGFDGTFLNDVWTLSLGGAPEWTKLTPLGTPPAARDDLPAAYDPVGDRMLIFGGWSGSTLLNDTWALELAGTPTWVQIPDVGPRPAPRRGSAAVYDEASRALVVFGGWPGFNDTHSLSLTGTPTWTEIPAVPNGLSRRWNHRAVYHPGTGRMILFAGVDLDDWRNDVWGLPLAGAPNWSRLETGPGPSSRRGHLAVRDPVRNRMILFGGAGGPSDQLLHNDSFVFALGEDPQWTPLLTSGSRPSGRFQHAGIYDPLRDRILVFGGFDGQYRNDLWQLSLGQPPTWTPLFPTGNPPSGRADLAAVYDPTGDRLMLIGGWDGQTLLDEVWALDLATLRWSRLQPTGPAWSARRAHAAVADLARSRVLVFGGWNGGAGFNDLWELDLGGNRPRWRRVSIPGGAPGPRWGHGAILDLARDRLVVIGGADLQGWRNDTWQLTLGSSSRWTELVPQGPLPERRMGHSVIYDPVGDRALVYGGIIGGQYLGDTWDIVWSGSGSAAVEWPLASSEPNEPRLRLGPVRAGSAVVRLSLVDSSPATLELFDLRGRSVWKRLLVGLGDGVHEISFGEGAGLRTGIYFARLRQGGQQALAKLVHVR